MTRNLVEKGEQGYSGKMSLKSLLMFHASKTNETAEKAVVIHSLIYAFKKNWSAFNNIKYMFGPMVRAMVTDEPATDTVLFVSRDSVPDGKNLKVFQFNSANTLDVQFIRHSSQKLIAHVTGSPYVSTVTIYAASGLDHRLGVEFITPYFAQDFIAHTDVGEMSYWVSPVGIRDAINKATTLKMGLLPRHIKFAPLMINADRRLGYNIDPSLLGDALLCTYQSEEYLKEVIELCRLHKKLMM